MRNWWQRVRNGRNGRVVMFHVGRSGSQVVGDMLSQHPRIAWAHEIFLDVMPRQAGALPPPDFAPISYISARADAGERPFFGMEVKFYHLDLLNLTLPDFLQQLDHLHFRHYVVLQRQNLLRKIVSSAIAHQTHRWHQPAGETAMPTPVTLDIEAVSIDAQTRPLLDFLQGYDHAFRELRRLLAARQSLWLTYEEDVAPGPARAYGRICQFLGVKPQPVTVRYGRTNPFPLSQLLANYDDVAEALATTPFAWMLTA